MRKEILGVSWLNGQLKFASARKGLTVATWECKDRVDGLGSEVLDLGAVLQEAAQHTRYGGIDMALVLEHGRLNQQLVETPPAEGRDLELYIERRVSQLKVIEEEVVWSWQLTQPTKMARAVMLHLFPKPWLDQMIQGCRKAGLHLLIMVSPTVVLASQLSQLPLESNEMALVAAETEGTTAIIIGRKEGAIFLGRCLRCSWQKDPGRVIAEINRTMLYVKQQFAANVRSIWLFGQGAQQQAAAMRHAVEVPVNLSPVEFTPFYWVEQAVKLSPEVNANLISKELQKAPQRRILVRITSFLLGLLVTASVLLSAWVETQVRTESNALGKLKLKVASWQTQKEDLAKRFAELDQKRQLVQLIDEQKLPPVPGWFLGHLANTLPTELLLTELQVRRMDGRPGVAGAAPENLWAVRLAGAAQAGSETNNTGVRAAFMALTNELSNGPFHLKITNMTGQFAPAVSPAGVKPAGAIAAAGALPGVPARTSADGRNQFFIEGLMR